MSTDDAIALYRSELDRSVERNGTRPGAPVTSRRGPRGFGDHGLRSALDTRGGFRVLPAPRAQ